MSVKKLDVDQITLILNQYESGVSAGEICDKYKIRKAALYNWKSKYLGAKVKDVYVSISGAPLTGKNHVLEKVVTLASNVLNINFSVIRHCASTPSVQRGYCLDSRGTIETQFAADATCIDLENKFKHKAKISNRSILDAFAYAKVNNLGLDTYYEAQLQRAFNYSVLVYIPLNFSIHAAGLPLESSFLNYQQSLDSALRFIIKKYSLPVQVVSGDLEQVSNLILESLKLRI